jgi:hypothetical protein
MDAKGFFFTLLVLSVILFMAALSAPGLTYESTGRPCSEGWAWNENTNTCVKNIERKKNIVFE